MDVTNIASLATSLSNAKFNQEISTAVLKKAMDVSAEGAIALLGQNINTTA